MLADFFSIKQIYIACGRTDMRRSIDGLATIVQKKFPISPFQPTLFLFSGRKHDRLKTNAEKEISYCEMRTIGGFAMSEKIKDNL